MGAGFLSGRGDVLPSGSGGGVRLHAAHVQKGPRGKPGGSLGLGLSRTLLPPLRPSGDRGSMPAGAQSPSGLAGRDSRGSSRAPRPGSGPRETLRSAPLQAAVETPDPQGHLPSSSQE